MSIQISTGAAVTAANFFNPETLHKAFEMASVFAGSTMIPAAYYGKPENIVVAWAKGLPLGMNVFQAMESITCINGRASLNCEALLALARASGFFEKMEESLENGRAVCTIWRKGQGQVTRSFSTEDAKKAGLLGKKGSAWDAYPDRMLTVRARAFALRDLFPDVFLGIACEEEMKDVELSASLQPVTNCHRLNGEYIKDNEEKKDNIISGVNLSYEKKTDSDKPSQEGGLKWGVNNKGNISNLPHIIEKVNSLTQEVGLEESVQRWVQKKGFSSVEELPEEDLIKLQDFLEAQKDSLREPQTV